MIKNLTHTTIAMLTLVMVSCSSIDELEVILSPEDCISFSQPTVNMDATLGNFADAPNTRATLSSSINKFQVWGFCVPNNLSGNPNIGAVEQDWNHKSTFFTSNECADVFNNITVTNNVNGFTSYANIKTWDGISANANARYAFIGSYVPEGLGSFSMAKAYQTTEVDEQGNNKSYGPRLSFTIPINSNDVNASLNYKNQPDALVAARFDHLKSNGRVNLSFFHFMTGLHFKFLNHTSNKELVIKRVTFRGIFHKTVTFDFTTDDPVMSVSDTYAGTFTLFEGDHAIPPGGAEYMRESEGNNPVTFLLLPNPDGTTEQDENFTLGSQKEINIVYTIGGGQERTFTYGKNFTLNYIPQPNTLHTAYFNFVGDEFVVMFQADDEKNWENGSDNNVTIL